jgi:hypothetical protein
VGKAPNEAAGVIYATLSVEGKLDVQKRAAVDEIVRRNGGTTTWRVSEAAGRSYALLEVANQPDIAAIEAASGGRLYDRPIIAMALFPALPEALPSLLEALGGEGRPAGVLACLARASGAILEWDPAVTPVPVIIDLIDVELRRFRSPRRAELLAPLPPSLAARIAADGLQAPEIAPQRVLELRIDA